jgi:hypothetical protein
MTAASLAAWAGSRSEPTTPWLERMELVVDANSDDAERQPRHAREGAHPLPSQARGRRR